VCACVCRYAVSQRAQAVGQAVGLPTFMALFSFIGETWGGGQLHAGGVASIWGGGVKGGAPGGRGHGSASAFGSRLT
jgi:hypothetical protein